VHMPLAAHRFVAKFSRCVDHRAKEKLSSFEFGSNIIAADVHYDGISRIWPGACGVTQTWPNIIQRARFGLRAERAGFITKSQRLMDGNDTDARIEFHAFVLKAVRMVAH